MAKVNNKCSSVRAQAEHAGLSPLTLEKAQGASGHHPSETLLGDENL